MIVDVGMTKSSKKRGVHGLVVWKIRDMNNCKERRCPESGEEMEASKTEIAMGD